VHVGGGGRVDDRDDLEPNVLRSQILEHARPCLEQHGHAVRDDLVDEAGGQELLSDGGDP
jgi:hypothetical protein